MSEPKKPAQDVEILGEHDPCEHAYDYVDGDMDDYGPGDQIDNADTADKHYSEDDK